MSRRGRLRKRMRREDIEDVEEKLEALEEDVEPEKKAPAAAAKPEDRVLELQKAAGNRATGAAIQRWAGPVLQMASRWPKTQELRIGGLVVPIEAFSGGPTGGEHGSARTDGDRATGPGDVSIVTKQGAWMDKLIRMSRESSGIDKAEILIPFRDEKGMRWILTEVEITAISFGSDQGEPTFTLALSYKKRAFADTPR